MSSIEKCKKEFLDILYPLRCPVCHDIAVPRGQRVCKACRKQLKPAAGPRCFRCSRPLDKSEQEYCRNCRNKSYHYDRGIGIFTYGTVLQKSLIKLKYENRQEYGTFYGEFAASYAREQIFDWKIEVLMPIPLHWKRMEKRGYNQAEIIARAAGKKLNLPVDTTVLKRVINTKPQKELSEKERKENLKNAFEVRGKMKYKKILLIDDIYTTGSTINAAAGILKKAGAENIYFLTIAIGTDG